MNWMNVLSIAGLYNGGDPEPISDDNPLPVVVKNATPIAVTGPVTATELNAAGLALEATQNTIAGIVQTALDTALSTRSSETTLAQVLVKLGDILASTEAIAIDADNIAIDADSLNLNTDELETVMKAIRDRLPLSLGQKPNAESLAIVLSTAQEAILATQVDKLTTIAANSANWDIALSALRNALLGAGNKSFTDVVNALTGTLSVSLADSITRQLGKIGLTDFQLGRDARVSLLSDLWVCERHIRFQDSLADGIDPNKWATSFVGSGSFISAQGVGRIGTGATANSSSRATSSITPQYIHGAMTLWHSGVRAANQNALNTRRWGLYNDNDGFFFELLGFVLRAGFRSSVSGAPVDSSEIIDTSLVSTILGGSTGGVLDSLSHTYELAVQGNQFLFYIDRVLVKNYTGNVSTSRTATLNFPCRYENINSGGLASDIALDVRGANISTRGAFPLISGRRGYTSGNGSGTVTLNANQRLLSVSVVATSNGVSYVVNGGNSIGVPNNTTSNDEFDGEESGAVIQFTGSGGVWKVWYAY